MSKPVGQQLAARALAARSTLYRWLFENHDEIASVLAAQRRLGWQALAATAADAGVRTAGGDAPSRHLVRKTWKMVERDRTKPGQHQPAPLVQPVVEQKPIPKTPPVQPPAPPDKPRHVFQVATFRNDKDS